MDKKERCKKKDKKARFIEGDLEGEQNRQRVIY